MINILCLEGTSRKKRFSSEYNNKTIKICKDGEFPFRMARMKEDEFEKELTYLQQLNFKTSAIRKEYENRVHALKALGESMLSAGYSVEEVSRKLHSKRRELGKVYKDAAPPLFRQYIYWATENVYGDPLGPSYEQLRQSKSCEEIIESSSIPIPDLDQRLTLEGFKKWYETNSTSVQF